jgi:hypothetical protein
MSIESISRKELYDIVASTPQWRQLADENALGRANVEGFGLFLDGGRDPSLRRISLPPHLKGNWKRVKDLLYAVLCTEDTRYSDVRGVVFSQTSVQTVVNAIAAHLGGDALVLSPFVALSLLTVINRGREAYCKERALGTKLIDLQPKDTDPEDRHEC